MDPCTIRKVYHIMNVQHRHHASGSCAIVTREKEGGGNEPLKMSPIPDIPRQEVSIDIFSLFPTGEYLLVVIDDYSQFPEVGYLLHPSQGSDITLGRHLHETCHTDNSKN